MPPANRKPPLTHFLCLPLITPHSRPQLTSSLSHFTSDLSHSSPQLPTTAIRPASTLHLTLGVLSLPSPSHLDHATSLLHSLDPASLLSPPGPLTVSLKGLHPMHSPTSTSVLYAFPHDPTSRLQDFATAVRDRFMRAEVLVRDDRPLKLHATIFNTVYVRGEEKLRLREMATRGARRKGRGPSVAFDMRDVIERYEDFTWAEGVRIDRVAICEMGAKEVPGGRDAEYTEVASVSITDEGVS